MIQNKKKFAVSFRGGMARGLGCIGLVRFLQEENLKPTIYSGSSSGALVAAAYAMDYPWDLILKRASEAKIQSLFSLKNLITNRSFVSKAKFLDFLSDVVGQDIIRLKISDLPNKFLCFSTNIKTGKKEIIKSGNLGDALLASCAYPLIMPRGGEFKNLVDGDFVSSYSANELREMGVDIVLGTRYLPGKSGVKTNVINSIIDTYRFVSYELNRYDAILNPVDFEILYGIGTTSYIDFSSAIELSEVVYRKAKRNKKEILKLLDAE